jgi:hypothetical protein
MNEQQKGTRSSVGIMYRKPRFLEILHKIREEMSREADYDVDLFAEMVRTGKTSRSRERNIRGVKRSVPRTEEEKTDAPRSRRRKRAGG